MTLTIDPQKPSLNQWGTYQAAFDYFNGVLFNDNLPHCILNFSRSARYRGFFASRRWHNQEHHIHEISLNPDLLDEPLIQTMSTLVHEMCHLWKYEFGKTQTRSGYHCREWANKMIEVGLMPFNVKDPKKQTGFKVSHVIVTDGRFEGAFHVIPEKFAIPWKSKPFLIAKSSSRSDKVKYTCSCSHNVWGKTGLAMFCIECERPFIELRANSHVED